MADQPGQDFFVSYTQTDRAWAEWIAWELEAAGYTTQLQAWDMPAGTAFVHGMDQAVQHTRHTILVLSPAYLRSAMAEAEWRPAFKADPSGQARRLLPVRVEDCEPEGLLADRVYIDLVGSDEATARARLREEVERALRGPGRPDTRPRFPRAPAAAARRPRFPTALPPIWNVPFRRNPTFTGRVAEFAALEPGAMAPHTQVLQGGGGIGKTTLAVEYAYQQRARFDTVWWVRAEQPATLVGDYAALAVELGLAEAGHAKLDRQLTASAVRRWLEDHDRWLLILDNADAPDTLTGLRAPLAQVVELLPQVVHGQVLITSRDTSWDQHVHLTELEVFKHAEAVEFLLARSGARDKKSAADVAELLGWLPLALEQAGGYVRETRISLRAYQAHLEKSPGAVLAKGTPRDRDPKDTVATTWRVSLERVRRVPGAVTLLEVCAFLAPDDVPRELFTQQIDPPVGELSTLADDPFALEEAVAVLHRFGLVKASEQTLTVHRLLQLVVREDLIPDKRRHWATVGVRLVLAGFPQEAGDYSKAWKTTAQLVDHALIVTRHISSEPTAPDCAADPEATVTLLNRVGDYLWGQAQFKQARSVLKQAISTAETCLGPAHPDTARSNHILAHVLYDEDDLDGARTLHERALLIRETCVGPDHPDTAHSLSNLATVLRDQGDLDGARTFQERALAIYEACLGPDDPATAASLDNLAVVAHDQNDLETARRLLERALLIREAEPGANHPTTAWSLNNLAGVLADQGDLAGARALHERALAIREAHLGANHPTTAQSLSNLATVLCDQGDLDQARALNERALSIREDRLGPDHRHTAISLNNLATVLRAQGHLQDARPLYERALAIREARLGPDHADTVGSREDLAAVVAELENRQ